MISNGKNILQIGRSDPGHGSKGRILSLLRGSKPSIHNKSFLVGLAEQIFQEENKAYISETDNMRAENIIHTTLGVHTNSTACVFIDGSHLGSIFEAQEYFFNKFIEKSKATASSNFESHAAYWAIYKLVQEGIRFQRSNGQPAAYRQGDVLTGSNLRSIGQLHLAKYWEEMTGHYFVYSDYHKHVSFEPKLNLVVKKVAKSPDSMPAPSESDYGIWNPPESIVVKNDQLVIAAELVRKFSKELSTKNLYLETNQSYVVFEIEKPSRDPDKIRNILKSIGNHDVIVSQLLRTGKEKVEQYIGDDWGSCYYVVKVNKYQNKGFNYIDFLKKSSGSIP
jgi:hypothetical protein